MKLFVWGLFVGIVAVVIAQLVMGGMEFNVLINQNSVAQQLIEQMK